MNKKALTSHLDALLNIASIPDISCNGLQCDGKNEIKKIGLAVDACMQTYKQAVEKNCDIVIVHHGFIWDGLKSITGVIYKQLKFAIDHKLNVYAAHLPLDLHPDLGNNIHLSKILGLTDIKPFGEYHGTMVGFSGKLKKGLSNEEIGKIFQKKIGGTPTFLPFGKEKNTSIAIVSGACPEALHETIKKEIDCFITGEGTHWNHHVALESGINVIFLGHYHSEQHGVMALGKHLEETFGIQTEYLDDPTLL